jgi:NAD(P)-dependent dehydrogenase (short-subunit alcohol dehydrogenase family)
MSSPTLLSFVVDSIPFTVSLATCSSTSLPSLHSTLPSDCDGRKIVPDIDPGTFRQVLNFLRSSHTHPHTQQPVTDPSFSLVLDRFGVKHSRNDGGSAGPVMAESMVDLAASARARRVEGGAWVAEQVDGGSTGRLPAVVEWWRALPACCCVVGPGVMEGTFGVGDGDGDEPSRSSPALAAGVMLYSVKSTRAIADLDAFVAQLVERCGAPALCVSLPHHVLLIAVAGVRVMVRLRLHRGVPECLLSLPEHQRVAYLPASGRTVATRGMYRALLNKDLGVKVDAPPYLASTLDKHPMPLDRHGEIVDGPREGLLAAGATVSEVASKLVARGSSLFAGEWEETPGAGPRRFKCYQCGAWLEASDQEMAARRVCGPCREVNAERRAVRADLAGMVAIVTGGRIKIGQKVVLRLLENGCTVVTTTRFPLTLLERLRSSPRWDESWAPRLSVYGLDLADLAAVERFVVAFKGKHDHLDILINNAAQTVRRPRSYYATLVEEETRLASGGQQSGGQQRALVVPVAATTGLQLSSLQQYAPLVAADPLSAQLAREDEAASDPHLFPPGCVDDHGEQADLRTANSWTMKVEEVSAVELLETHTINALAPFLLLSRLRSHLTARRHRNTHVVNVTSPEGAFHSPLKASTHPHTNMAKAALNQLTRTVAQDLANDRVFVNSVDTGYVSKNMPRPAQQRDRLAPLDDDDGAARVLAPIFDSIASGQPPVWGKHLVNFQPADW